MSVYEPKRSQTNVFGPGVSGGVDFVIKNNIYDIFMQTTHIFQAHPGPRWSAHGGPTQGPDGAPMEGPSRVQMERPWRAHPGPRWSAHGGPIQGPWRPKADQMEAEGRPHGGLGAKPPEKNHIEKNQGGPHQGHLTQAVEKNMPRQVVPHQRAK